MKNDEVILKFSEYQVDNIKYSVNKNFDKNKIMRRSPKIFYKIARDKNSDNFNIIISAIFDSTNNLPFHLQIDIRGFFETLNDFTEDEKLNIIISNGTAILFPYLRSIITDITSKSNFSPIILPTMNFSKIIEEDFKNNRDKHLSDSDYEKPIFNNE